MGKGVGEEVEASAVYRLLRHDMSAVRGKRLDGVGDCGGSGGDGESRASALEGGNSLLKNVLSGVREPAVNIPCVGKTEAVGGVLAVMENVRGGLVNGNGAGIGRGIGLFLADVKLKGLEFILAHF